MNIATTDIYGAVLVGLGATAFMDAFGLVLRWTTATPLPNFRLVGRWVSYMPTGRLRHDNIGAAPPRPGEHAIGWVVHYLVGVVFAMGLVFGTSGAWLHRPSLSVAAAYGIFTVVFPFFVMQPSMGMGIAAANTPNPAKARLGSLRNHLAFGVGIYIASIPVRNLVIDLS